MPNNGVQLTGYLLSLQIHALYGEYNGVFEIESLEMIEGDLPNRAQKMVKE